MFKGDRIPSPGSGTAYGSSSRRSDQGTFFREAFCQPESEETMENIAGSEGIHRFDRKCRLVA